MATERLLRSRTRVLVDNPLEGEDLLRETLFRARPAEARREPADEPKPQHYKVVSISLYNEDIERLDDMVRELKRRGHYRANKSRLIRYALAQLDLSKVPNVDF
ncbi:MAG: hypothetical protein AAB426_04935 [Myxococcota bacterium]